jgi:hypothetical protein
MAIRLSRVCANPAAVAASRTTSDSECTAKDLAVSRIAASPLPEAFGPVSPMTIDVGMESGRMESQFASDGASS